MRKGSFSADPSQGFAELKNYPVNISENENTMDFKFGILNTFLLFSRRTFISVPDPSNKIHFRCSRYCKEAPTEVNSVERLSWNIHTKHVVRWV